MNENQLFAMLTAIIAAPLIRGTHGRDAIHQIIHESAWTAAEITRICKLPAEQVEEGVG